MIGFGPSGAQDYNARCLRVCWLTLFKLRGGCGLTGMHFQYSMHSAVRSRLVGLGIVQIRSPNRCTGQAALRRLEVTKETMTSPLFPVRQIVRIDAGART